MDPIIPVIVPYGRDITPELGVRETRARLAVAVRERLAASSGMTEGGGSMTPLSATERVRQVACLHRAVTAATSTWPGSVGVTGSR